MKQKVKIQVKFYWSLKIRQSNFHMFFVISVKFLTKIKVAKVPIFFFITKIFLPRALRKELFPNFLFQRGKHNEESPANLVICINFWKYHHRVLGAWNNHSLFGCVVLQQSKTFYKMKMELFICLKVLHFVLKVFCSTTFLPFLIY